MKPTRLSAAAAALVLVAGCGGDSGPSNAAPTANFDAPTCAQLSCTFTDASTDGDGTIASRAWTFESGTPATSTDASPTVAFAAAGTYTVTLTATDNDGASDDFSRDVTVTDVAGNTNPLAEFDASCSSLDCTFTDQSSDPDAGDGVASWDWDFGDGSAHSNEQNPAHTYTATEVTTETVALTVTDNNGGTATKTHSVTLAPPAGLNCNGADCSLDLPSAAVVTVTLASEDCNADGNTFIIKTPVLDTLFTDGCHLTTPAQFILNNGSAFASGTQITAAVVSGSADLAFTPTIRVTGSFPDWMLEFDDGEAGDPGGVPDFNDLVLTVHAEP